MKVDAVRGDALRRQVSPRRETNAPRDQQRPRFIDAVSEPHKRPTPARVNRAPAREPGWAHPYHAAEEHLGTRKVSEKVERIVPSALRRRGSEPAR